MPKYLTLTATYLIYRIYLVREVQSSTHRLSDSSAPDRWIWWDGNLLIT